MDNNKQNNAIGDNTYEGKAINAFFHSNSGGKTETTLNVWGAASGAL